jgi:hypothetical protein
MIISICDWCACGGLQGTEWEYMHNKPFEGTLDQAKAIAHKLFDEHKLNVMMLHRTDGIIIAIDTRSFGQR